MSASKPVKGRINIKKPGDGPVGTTASLKKPIVLKNPAVVRQLNAEGSSSRPKMSKAERLARMPVQKRSAPSAEKRKAKEVEQSTASPGGMDEDEDDDMEEVPIPSNAGPSSPHSVAPTTPGTNLTRGTNTPGTMTADETGEDSDEDGYGGYGSDEPGGEAGLSGAVLTLELNGETQEQREKRIALAMRKKPLTSKDRAIRLEIHKMHVIALLASTKLRNRWCCNNLLKARLLSLLPHPLHSAFNIPPSRFPDRAQRSRLFFDALQSLVTWWSQSFFDISDPALGLRTRTWDEVNEIVEKLPKMTRADFAGASFDKAADWTDAMDTLAEGSGAEKLRSVNSLMKKVLQQEGSRDISAQLFVALARSCGLGARLVVSLQPVPWRAEKVVPKTKKSGAGRKGKSVASRQGNGTATDDAGSEEDMEEVPIPDPNQSDGAPGAVMTKMRKKGDVRAAGKRRLQDPADMYRLRKPPAQKLSSAAKPKKKREDLSNQPPVYWAEIFSRSDQRWIPVDPILGIIRKKSHYEPQSDNGPIRMMYVVAFEEDNHARDVTLRYTRNFGAKTVKLRPPTRKDEPDWWATVMGFLERPYRLNRDELEDAELETSQVSEGMPQHMNGFKDHPIYVLERHLKREEVIMPKKEIGKFRGEPVYRRNNVLSCKTAENWMRIGRRVKERETPMKWVKQRAVTLQKRRAQELSIQESGEAIQQGLYAEHQTEVYRPPPIKDGVIPQNSFGNIDLYAPTMLPEGAVHLPYKGIAKVAKSLGISYAEACTGFEFKKQRAIPVITGIVVAEENEATVLDAYEESAAAAEEREKAKRVDRALKRWAKLVNGLRVRRRLQAEYGTGDALDGEQRNPLADPKDTNQKTPTKSAGSVIANANKRAQEAWNEHVKEKSPSLEPIIIEDDEDDDDDESVQIIEPANHVRPIHGPADYEKAEIVDAVRLDEDGEKDAADLPEDDAVTVVDFVDNPSTSLTDNKATRRAASGTASRRQSTRTPKRRAVSPVSDKDSSDADKAKSNNRKKPKRQVKPKPKAATTVAPTRTLRSRTSKTEEQIKEEEEARQRIRNAMASDEELTDDED